ncbi:uncharacterized protein [Panulirus ornatus]|uniref:uncharacterized protein n=1 Tax=Panulirus ornatus TaxID=150431 RepID=UPI003A8B7B95
MPKGKHKGGRRQFTNFEALKEQKQKEEKERQWRKDQGETDSEDEDGSGSGSSSEDSSTDEDEVKQPKAKGVGGLIECENPNRVINKPKKASSVNATSSGTPSSGKTQLSRREREELQKQRATAYYRKLHAEGKTEEARADLARLAIIRQQREEAAKKKEEEKKAREATASVKKEQIAKALNKNQS